MTARDDRIDRNDRNDQMPKCVSSRLAELEVRPEAWHPDADLLTAFLERALPDGEKGVILGHLAECASCREIATLAQPMGEERQMVLVAQKPSAGRLLWRWGALAACAALAVSLVVHRRENRSLTLAQQTGLTGPVSAGSKPSPAVRSENDASTNSTTQTVIAGSLATERRVAPLTLEPSAPTGSSMGPTADSAERKDAQAVGEVPSASNSTGRLQDLDASAAPPPSSAPSPGAVGANLGANVARSRVADSALEVTGNVLAKKEADLKSEQTPSKAKAHTYDSVETAQAVVTNAPAASSQPATPVAPTEKGEFRASAAQMGSAAAFSSARQAATWQITDAGNLQRSSDGGKTWESISVNQPARLRVVASAGFHVWVGGNGGLLFHSADGGSHFALLKVGQNSASLTGDIVTLAFADAQNGRLETSIHEVWTTSDGGKTWLPSAPAK